jgi:hypothetical protein
MEFGRLCAENNSPEIYSVKFGADAPLDCRGGPAAFRSYLMAHGRRP